MLNEEQKQRLRRVIEQDAETTGYLRNPHTGKCCFAGGLLLFAGVPPGFLTGKRSVSEVPGGDEAIKSYYGIDSAQTVQLIRTNDTYSEVDRRRHALRVKVSAM